MARIMPRAREELAEFEPLFDIVEETMGFVPTSLYTMAHNPALLRAVMGLCATVLGPGRLEVELKRLVRFVSSATAGCLYCQALAAHGAHRAGTEDDKIRAALDFESSELFDDRERTALRFARDASSLPNGVQDSHFEALRKHFNEAEILELVSLVALTGFLNRWNDTVATRLEESPRTFANGVLGPAGWHVGKHR